METIRVNMTPCNEVETIHASQNDTSLRKWGIRPYDYDGNDVTNQQDKATLVDIKGQTLKWNQLVQNGNFASTSGWTVYQPANASINANSNVLTETLTISTLAQGNAYTIGLQKTNVISDATHKYLCFVTITLSFTSNVRIELGGWPVLGTNPINANTKTTLSFVSTAYTYNKNLLIYPQSGVVGIDLSGQTIKYENIMLIDLTLMFGAGNEPTAVDEFTSLFPLSYYPYDSGSLIPFMGNGIKTVGKNQLNLGDSKSATANGVTASYDASTQKVTLSGTNTKTDSAYILINFTPSSIPKFKIGETYVVSASSQIPTNTYFNLVYRDTSNALQGLSLTQIETRRAWRFTVPSNYSTFNAFQIGVLKEARQLNGEFGIQLEFGSTATAYEPYTESLLNLPISTYFPSGMKDVPDYANGGKIYDEMTSSKAKTRVGIVDLGSLEWTSANTSTQGISRMRTASLGNVISKPSNVSVRANVICANYETLTANSTYIKNTGISIDNGGDILVYDPNYNTSESVASFKQAMSGKYLYFELATPTETDISPELDLTFNIDKGGTEELLPSGLLNGSVDLGSLTWGMESSGRFYSSSISGMKNSDTWNATKFYSDLDYTVQGVQTWVTDDKIIGVYGTSIYIRDSSYASADDLRNAMQGVYLWYETTDSTPTTTPLNATVKYPAETKDVYFTYQVSDFLSTVFKFYLVTKGIQIPCELEDDTLVADCTSEISNEPGFFDCKIKAENDLGQIFSNKFQLHIERSPQ